MCHAEDLAECAGVKHCIFIMNLNSFTQTKLTLNHKSIMCNSERRKEERRVKEGKKSGRRKEERKEEWKKERRKERRVNKSGYG